MRVRYVNGPLHGQCEEVDGDHRVLLVFLPDEPTPEAPVSMLTGRECVYVRAHSGFPGQPVPYIYRNPDGSISAAWEGGHGW